MKLLEPYPWDYLLGSIHWLDGQAVDSRPGIWATTSVDEVWRRYFAALAGFAAAGVVDVLAHPDLPKIFGRRLDEPERFYPRLFGTALEIPTAGLQVGDLYPDPVLLVGHPPITLGPDARCPQNVGRDFERALELAITAGYEIVTVFERQVARQEPLG
jgi:histidinol-phosphatase (PHP family)